MRRPENARVIIAKASTGSSSSSNLNPKVKESPIHLKMVSEIYWLFMMMDSVKKSGPAISIRIPVIPVRGPGKTALVSSRASLKLIRDFSFGIFWAWNIYQKRIGAAQDR